jgi:hypothetical protein
MGCSASVPTPAAIAEEARCAALPSGKRERLPVEKQAPGDSHSRREAPYSGDAAAAAAHVPARHGCEVAWQSLSPAMVIIDDFLSPEECDALIALASGGAAHAPAPLWVHCSAGALS